MSDNELIQIAECQDDNFQCNTSILIAQNSMQSDTEGERVPPVCHKFFQMVQKNYLRCILDICSSNFYK